MERIDDTDSSSDGEDDLLEAKLPTIQKAKPVHGKSKRQRAREEEALKASAATNEDEDSEQGSDAEDIPLSDIESLDEEDREDVVPYQRLTINNISALQAAHKRIALDIPKLAFSIHQSVTTAEPVVIEDIDDDLNRELAFYSQSLSAVKEARILLKAEGNAFSRPVDYFAEMVKSDEHMGRVKAKLVDEAAGKKAAAEARKQRDLKKFGKQVQVAKGQERDKAKRDTLEKIKVLKRSKSFSSPWSICRPKAAGNQSFLHHTIDLAGDKFLAISSSAIARYYPDSVSIPKTAVSSTPFKVNINNSSLQNAATNSQLPPTNPTSLT